MWSVVIIRRMWIQVLFASARIWKTCVSSFKSVGRSCSLNLNYFWHDCIQMFNVALAYWWSQTLQKPVSTLPQLELLLAWLYTNVQCSAGILVESDSSKTSEYPQLMSPCHEVSIDASKNLLKENPRYFQSGSDRDFLVELPTRRHSSL